MQGWPVQILFQHSEPLNSALWTLGIESNAEGLAVRPRVPMKDWSWAGPGLSLHYGEQHIHGHLSGACPEHIRLVLQLPAALQGGAIEVEENGVTRKIDKAGQEAILELGVGPNTTTQFAVRKA